MRARSSSGKFSFQGETKENPRNLFFWGDDPKIKHRLQLAGAAFPGLAVSFPETLPGDGFCCDAGGLRVIPASALAAGVSCRAEDPPTLAYGPIEYMAQAFLCGCADYLVEPWLPEELFLRCNKMRDIYRINFPGCTVRYTPFALFSRHKVLPLSLPEFLLLKTFTQRLNTPIARGELFRILGYTPGKNSPRLVDAHICLLRKKLASCCSEPENSLKNNPIRQVRGMGYGLWNTM